VTDYLIIVIKEPKENVFLYFSITAITAPVFGAILSGILCSKLGGYEAPMTLPSCMLSGLLCSFCAIIVPSQDNF
jgi:hypothetical protein